MCSLCRGVVISRFLFSYILPLLGRKISFVRPQTTDRKQRVKIGEAFSDWLPVSAGVPQGTKLGLILFLIMINDLAIPSPETNLWKFVDNVPISECLTKNGGASIQSTLETDSSWASMDLMKPNANKCEELRVCFFKAPLNYPPYELMDKYSKQFVRTRF